MQSEVSLADVVLHDNKDGFARGVVMRGVVMRGSDRRRAPIIAEMLATSNLLGELVTTITSVIVRIRQVTAATKLLLVVWVVLWCLHCPFWTTASGSRQQTASVNGTT